MDKNNVIGLTLIFILLFLYMQINQKTPEQLAEEQRVRDSIANEMQLADLSDQENNTSPTTDGNSSGLALGRLNSLFCPFTTVAEPSDSNSSCSSLLSRRIIPTRPTCSSAFPGVWTSTPSTEASSLLIRLTKAPTSMIDC